MRARVDALSPRALLAIAIFVVLVFAAAAWFLVVSPKRADANAAKDELAAAHVRLADAELARARAESTAPVADVFRLAKAMPSSTEQAGLVLELSKLAASSGVVLEGMTPQPPLAAIGGPTLMPVSVTVRGRYANITRFLKSARMLVKVDDGKIHATGRLLSARSVMLAESDTGDFPELDATIGFDAYVYDGPLEAPEPPAEETDEEADTTVAAGSTH